MKSPVVSGTNPQIGLPQPPDNNAVRKAIGSNLSIFDCDFRLFHGTASLIFIIP